MISQAVGYAASALGYVAAAGGRPLLVKEIADAAGIPAPYLSKIIHALARKGIVATQRGIGGGVTLARAAHTIRLLDLCIALDDPHMNTRCLLCTQECSDERCCPVHQFWNRQRTACNAYLERMSVADLATFEARQRANPAARTLRTPSTPRPAPSPPRPSRKNTQGRPESRPRGKELGIINHAPGTPSAERH